jgi:RNA polymerase sigma factor (sigma-70 family)
LVLAYAPLSREEEQTASPEKLFYHNLRFALLLSRGQDREGHEDRKAAALRGLWEAAQTYDPSKANGGRFIHFARFKVRGSLSSSFAEKFSGLHLPRSARRLLGRLRDGEDLGALRTRRFSGLVAVSLDNGAAEAGDSLHGLIHSEAPDPRQEMLADEAAPLLKRWFEKALDKREAFVLTRLFGLDGEEPENLRQLAGKLGVTYQRVEQIEKKALRKLREFKRLKNAW